MKFEELQKEVTSFYNSNELSCVLPAYQKGKLGYIVCADMMRNEYGKGAYIYCSIDAMPTDQEICDFAIALMKKHRPC